MSEKIFIGIGAGPIQTGIYVAGASAGNFDRIVLADVDLALVEAVKKHRSLTINTACKDSVRTDTYQNIEIYNPNVPEEAEILTDLASKALAINTALPATKFYQFSAPWLRAGFERNPEGLRYVYTSENSTTAAAQLEEKIDKKFPRTYYLDTVIGKMSKVFAAGDNDLPTLVPGYGKGHLVEEFCTIYTSDAPGIENVGIKGLYPRADLVPFEEAKLYGHNATHMVMAVLARQKGCRFMSESVKYPEIVDTTLQALLQECGPALCKKFAGKDEYFEMANYAAWAKELVVRMTSPILADAVERVARDLDRKLAWNDRLIGAIRLCQSQGVDCPRLRKAAALAARFYALDTIGAEWPAEEGGKELIQLLGKE